MLTPLIAAVIGVLVGSFIGRDLQSPGWGIACGVAGVMLTQLVIGLILRRLILRRQNGVQQLMIQAQEKARRQLELFQQRQPGNLSGARQLAARLQSEAAKNALAATAGFAKYYKWSPLLKRQIGAMQMQLYYQLHDFKKVDALLKTALLADPQSLAIKLVRCYRNGDPGLDRFYARKCRRLKGDNGAFVASVYAWIKLQQDQRQAAIDALVAAKKLSDNAILAENCDRLLNGKVKHYSLHGFGDMWYALELEEIKVKPQKMRMGRPY